MTGEFFLGVAIILTLAAVILVGWLAFQNVKLAESTQETNRAMLELVVKQSALIAAADAMTYQAIRVMDQPGSYDEGSNTPEVEESTDELGYERDLAADIGFVGDPFVGGDIFDQKF